MGKHAIFWGFWHFTAQRCKIQKILLWTLYKERKICYKMASLPDRYFRAKARKIEFEQWKIPIFTFLRETVLDMGKIDGSTFVPREILYPKVKSNVPYSMKIVYSYDYIHKPWFFRDISEGNRRREEPVADLNSATSKTPYAIFGSNQLRNFFSAPKNGKAIVLPFFWGQKIFFESRVDMGGFRGRRIRIRNRFFARAFYLRDIVV